MKGFSFLIAGLLFAVPTAGAQVIINRAALDQLAGIAPAVPHPAHHAAPRQPVHHRVVHRPAPRPLPASLRPAAGLTPLPVPPKPGTKQAVARPITPAPAAPEPAAPEPAVPKPKPAAPPPKLLPPVRIAFPAGAAALPAGSAAVLKPFCAHPGGVITIDAYAAADPNDPSEAARLSMNRAFAIRDALTACGVPSSDIIPRADGAAKNGNPDAAEVALSP